MTREGKRELLVEGGPSLHYLSVSSWSSLFSPLQLRWQCPSLSWHKEMTVVFLFLGLPHGSAAGPQWSTRSCSLRRWVLLYLSFPFSPKEVGASSFIVQCDFVNWPCLISAGRGGTLHCEAPSWAKCHSDRPAARHSLPASCEIHHTSRAWALLPRSGISHPSTR